MTGQILFGKKVETEKLRSPLIDWFFSTVYCTLYTLYYHILPQSTPQFTELASSILPLVQDTYNLAGTKTSGKLLRNTAQDRLKMPSAQRFIYCVLVAFVIRALDFIGRSSCTQKQSLCLRISTKAASQKRHAAVPLKPPEQRYPKGMFTKRDTSEAGKLRVQHTLI